LIDELTHNMTVNFFCEFPCATCNLTQTTQCYSCYGGADERYYHDFACLDDCPHFMYETTSNNCSFCEFPCFECEEQPNQCTVCFPGYTLVPETASCREIVNWPFPFAATAGLCLIIALLSEACTRGESRFKEACVSLISIPEFLSWICFGVFLTNRIGPKGTSASAIFAIFIYIVLNFTHAIVHRK